MNSITLFLFFIPALALILLGVNLIFAPHNPYQEKSSTFECGFHSFLGQNRMQFSISFFIFALLFLVFDLELVMTTPAFISMYTITYYGLIFIIIFFTILALGFAFEIGKKALKIDSKQYNNTLPGSLKVVHSIFTYIAVQIFEVEKNFILLLKKNKCSIPEMIDACLYLYSHVIAFSIFTYIMLFFPPIVGCMIVLCPLTLITLIVNSLFFFTTSLTVWLICLPYVLSYKNELLWGLYWTIVVIGIALGIITDPIIIITPPADNFGLDLIFMNSNNFGGPGNGPLGGPGGGPTGGPAGGPGNGIFPNPFGPNSRNRSINPPLFETPDQFDRRMLNRTYLFQRIAELEAAGIPVYSATELTNQETLYGKETDHILRRQYIYNMSELERDKNHKPLDIYDSKWDGIDDGWNSLKRINYKKNLSDLLSSNPNYEAGATKFMYVKKTHPDYTTTQFYPDDNTSRKLIATPLIIDHIEAALKAKNPNRGGYGSPLPR